MSSTSCGFNNPCSTRIAPSARLGSGTGSGTLSAVLLNFRIPMDFFSGTGLAGYVVEMLDSRGQSTDACRWAGLHVAYPPQKRHAEQSDELVFVAQAPIPL